MYLADELATFMAQRNGQIFTELIAILPADEAGQIQELALILTNSKKFDISHLAEAEKEFLVTKNGLNYWDENGQNSASNGQNEVKPFKK